MNNKSGPSFFGRVMKHHVSEFLEGYIVIGFERGTGTPVVAFDIQDPKTALAVNSLMSQIIVNGGVGVAEDEESE